MSTVKQLTSHDRDVIKVLSNSLASAFVDDPMFSFVLRNRKQSKHFLERFARFYESCIDFSLIKNTTIHFSEDESCTAIWFHDHGWDDERDMGMILGPMFRCFGFRTFTFLKLTNAIKKVHIEEPHTYLWILGTAKHSQGKGHGSRVISKVLKECDERGSVAYLESSNVDNLTFYRRHGFKDMTPLNNLAGGCPTITPMVRRPSTAQPVEH